MMNPGSPQPTVRAGGAAHDGKNLVTAMSVKEAMLDDD